jgi:hypothetical protein
MVELKIKDEIFAVFKCSAVHYLDIKSEMTHKMM